jgi:hypothetical protein
VDAERAARTCLLDAHENSLWADRLDEASHWEVLLAEFDERLVCGASELPALGKVRVSDVTHLEPDLLGEPAESRHLPQLSNSAS